MSKAMELTNLQQLAAAELAVAVAWADISFLIEENRSIAADRFRSRMRDLQVLNGAHADDPKWFPTEFKAGDILVKRDDLKIGSDGLRFMGQDGKVRDSEGDYQSKHPECYRLATDAEITCRIHDVRMFAHSQKTALTGQKRKGS